MKKIMMTLIAVFVCIMFVSPAMAVPIEVEFRNGPQDPLFHPDARIHELGDQPFPDEEWIVSSSTETDETSCFDGNDDPFFPNVLVSMTNRTGQNWPNVYYVADEGTTITNFDGWIGHPQEFLGEAFKIDRVGINRPLTFESLNPNGIFEVGETWDFIIQDFRAPGPPTPFDSVGRIAGRSGGWPPSTGSIIAAVPIPGALWLLGSGLIGLVGFKRKYGEK